MWKTIPSWGLVLFMVVGYPLGVLKAGPPTTGGFVGPDPGDRGAKVDRLNRPPLSLGIPPGNLPATGGFVGPGPGDGGAKVDSQECCKANSSCSRGLPLCPDEEPTQECCDFRSSCTRGLPPC